MMFSVLLMLILCVVGDSVFVSTVDIFNASSGLWTTATLSEPRYYLAATSLPSAGLAIFAGGRGMLCDVMSLRIVRVGMMSFITWGNEEVGGGVGGGGHVSSFAQSLLVFLRKLSTSSMLLRDYGPLQLSARLDTILPPHRCRARD
jgi:hypothetical protein